MFRQCSQSLFLGSLGCPLDTPSLCWWSRSASHESDQSGDSGPHDRFFRPDSPVLLDLCPSVDPTDPTTSPLSSRTSSLSSSNGRTPYRLDQGRSCRSSWFPKRTGYPAEPSGKLDTCTCSSSGSRVASRRERISSSSFPSSENLASASSCDLVGINFAQIDE